MKFVIHLILISIIVFSSSGVEEYTPTITHWLYLVTTLGNLFCILAHIINRKMKLLSEESKVMRKSLKDLNYSLLFFTAYWGKLYILHTFDLTITRLNIIILIFLTVNSLMYFLDGMGIGIKRRVLE